MKASDKRTKLLDQLNNNEISIEEYWRLIKKGSKPWETAEWKNKRKEYLKDQCENCGSTDNLTIQHGWKPEYSIILSQVQERYITAAMPKLLKRTFSNTAFSKYITKNKKQVKKCPNCQSATLSERSKMKPKFRCIKCHHEFDEPLLKFAIKTDRGYVDIDTNKEYFIEKFAKDDYYSSIRILLQKNKNKIVIEAINLLHESTQRYLAFEGVKTLCKRCAFIEDKDLGYINSK
ncbi:hypothetical protein [Draconibacterium sediminis]|uniref:Uncharacterized protein n=1 Tax=Draconibacterium sediminis TaxID=1544798 RepID=A0A0D8JC26_9BACT|nr:hypothetical protein [Draconibacterium sediminis]KJF44264.1 hypothetical protein LH29_01740 [Draconibacterium sediminis]